MRLRLRFGYLIKLCRFGLSSFKTSLPYLLRISSKDLPLLLFTLYSAVRKYHACFFEANKNPVVLSVALNGYVFPVLCKALHNTGYGKLIFM